MARSGRIKSEIGIYHVLLRGTNTLFPEDADFLEFQNLLKKYAANGSIKVFSYALLKNRVHLVVKAEDSVGKALKPLCTSYARYVNRTYAREGKLFYDRLKSEPINSRDELKNAVAFVNHLGSEAGDGYLHCSLSPVGSEICTSEQLTAAERKSCRITEMFIEDYDCISQDELNGYIEALCGISPVDFKNLSREDRQEALEILTKKKWIAKTKLYEILGIKNERVRTVQEKKEKPAEKKDELSVWLL